MITNLQASSQALTCPFTSHSSLHCLKVKGFEIICLIGLHVTAICRSGFRIQVLASRASFAVILHACFYCYTSFVDQATSLASCEGSGKGTPWIVLFPLKYQQMPSEFGPALLWSFRCSGLQLLLRLLVPLELSQERQEMTSRRTWFLSSQNQKRDGHGGASNPPQVSVSVRIREVGGPDLSASTILFCLNNL